MAGAPNTQSTLDRTDGTNKTSTSLSTNIIVKVNDEAVGAIQSLKIDEKREVQMLDEVGTDGHIDSMPIKSTNVSGSCNRARFDRLRIAAAFSRGFVHVKSQVYPFDMVILDTQVEGETLITVIKNVWITDISYTYKSDNWIIFDDMQWKAEDIYTTTETGERVVNNGENPRGLVPEVITGGAPGNVETLADTGQRRGSFDISGILDITGSVQDPASNL